VTDKNEHDGFELDIDTLIRENAQAVADYESSENVESKQQDLQDRQALRRVAGLSTELQDVSDAEYRQLRLEKVVLVGVWTQGTALDAENSLKELAALAETAVGGFGALAYVRGVLLYIFIGVEV
jgi:GTP-binding protein HflX